MAEIDLVNHNEDYDNQERFKRIIYSNSFVLDRNEVYFLEPNPIGSFLIQIQCHDESELLLNFYEEKEDGTHFFQFTIPDMEEEGFCQKSYLIEGYLFQFTFKFNFQEYPQSSEILDDNIPNMYPVWPLYLTITITSQKVLNG